MEPMIPEDLAMTRPLTSLAKIGRPFELLEWFSMVSVHNMALKPLEDILINAKKPLEKTIDEY